MRHPLPSGRLRSATRSMATAVERSGVLSVRLRDGATGAGARVGGVRGLGGMAARLRCMMVSGLAACVALALLLTVAEPAAGAWNWSFQSVPAPAVHVG